MKYLIIFLLFINLPAFGQESFDILRKAEAKYEKGKFKKATQLLAEADAMHDCTCGNCAITKENWITRLSSQIALEQGDYLSARTIIDSANLSFFPTPKLDSLLWLTYQMEYGKDSLSNMLDYGIENAFCETDSNYIVRMFLPLPNKEKIAFTPSLNGRPIYGWKYAPESIVEDWQKEFITTETYRWLKN